MKAIKELIFEDCFCPICGKNKFLLRKDTRFYLNGILGYNTICKECGFGNAWEKDEDDAVRKIKFLCYKEKLDMQYTIKIKIE
jgi:C4-type Zn-finger protein